MIPKPLSKLYDRIPLSRKFKEDAVWNIASMIVCGLAGLAVLFIISKAYGPETLGLFNLTFAIYVFLSQLAVGGVHFSVLKYAAQFGVGHPETRVIMVSGLASALFISLVIAAGTFVTRGWVGAIFRKPELTTSLRIVAPGLVFF